MQAVQDNGNERSGNATTTAPEGLYEDPDGIVWGRTDWDTPVGVCSRISIVPRSVRIDGFVFYWRRVHVASLRLSHKAALFLLQGVGLSDLLLPNHRISWAGGSVEMPYRLLLKSERFQPWEPLPSLSGLIFASFDNVPENVDQNCVLDALVKDVVVSRA